MFPLSLNVFSNLAVKLKQRWKFRITRSTSRTTRRRRRRICIRKGGYLRSNARRKRERERTWRVESRKAKTEDETNSSGVLKIVTRSWNSLLRFNQPLCFEAIHRKLYPNSYQLAKYFEYRSWSWMVNGLQGRKKRSKKFPLFATLARFTTLVFVSFEILFRNLSALLNYPHRASYEVRSTYLCTCFPLKAISH